MGVGVVFGKERLRETDGEIHLYQVLVHLQVLSNILTVGNGSGHLISKRELTVNT